MGMKQFFNRQTFSTVLELIGASLVVIGVSSFSVAAAFVVGGIALVGIGYLLG